MLNKFSRPTACVALIALVASAGLARAADPLFSNASPNPAVPALALQSTTNSGLPAPGASFWSEVADAGIPGSNSAAGCAAHASPDGVAFRVADNFTVPSGGWSLSETWFYVFSPEWTSNASPVSRANLRVWSGDPSAGGSQVVFGDTTTNRLLASEQTTIYRVFTTSAGPAITSPDTSRRVWKIRVALAAPLAQGSYWIDLQLTPSDPQIPVYTVPATLDIDRSQPGWNALQQTGGVWAPLVDSGKPPSGSVPLDLAFVLAGTIGSGCDAIDFNNDGVFPDTQDATDYLSVFAGGPCSTGGNCNDIDFNNDGVSPDSADIDSFLSVFAGGSC